MQFVTSLNEDECSICTFELREDENNITCCKCFKRFHTECLKMWYIEILKKGLEISCPLCRFEHLECNDCEHNKIKAEAPPSPTEQLIVNHENKECFMFMASFTLVCLLRIFFLNEQ